MRILLSFCLTVLCICTVFSQKEKIGFRLYSFEEGLSHRNTFKIQQDPHGFIWIATINGLNKYDGTRFVHYSNLSKENFIPQNYVSELLITSDTVLWMAGENNLTVLDGNSFRYKKINASKDSEIYNKTRTPGSLVEDDAGNIWNITYNKSSGESFLQKLGKDDRLQDVMKCEGNATKRGMIWANQYLYFANKENELLKMESGGKVVRQYNFPKVKNTEAWVVQLQMTDDGVLWALLDDGRLFYLPDGEIEFRKYNVVKPISVRQVVNTFLVEKN
ncbi:MAG: hypothetical protein AAF573_05595, partial [Bacteroidota bacterium]